jgi:hypothetical protein
MSDVRSIKKRMEALEVLIKETRDRLPAHSTKPPVMMELLDYEDEYEALMNQLQTFKSK